MKRGIFMRLFDLHCDTLGPATDVRAAFSQNTLAVDLRRGRRFSSWTQTFAAWVPDGLSAATARGRCAALLDTARRWMAETTDYCPVAGVADLMGVEPAFRAILSV